MVPFTGSGQAKADRSRLTRAQAGRHAPGRVRDNLPSHWHAAAAFCLVLGPGRTLWARGERGNAIVAGGWPPDDRPAGGALPAARRQQSRHGKPHVPVLDGLRLYGSLYVRRCGPMICQPSDLGVWKKVATGDGLCPPCDAPHAPIPRDRRQLAGKPPGARGVREHGNTVGQRSARSCPPRGDFGSHGSAGAVARRAGWPLTGGPKGRRAVTLWLGRGHAPVGVRSS